MYNQYTFYPRSSRSPGSSEKQNVAFHLTTFRPNSKIVPVSATNSKESSEITFRSNFSTYSLQNKQQNIVENKTKESSPNITKHCCCHCEHLNSNNVTGIKNILDKKTSTWIRVFWFIVLSFCIIVTIYQIVDRMQEFIRQPVAEHVAMTYENEITIPNITICPSVIQIETIAAYHFNYFKLKNAIRMLRNTPEATIETERIKHNLTSDQIKQEIEKYIEYFENTIIMLNKSITSDIQNSLHDLREEDIEITWQCSQKGNNEEGIITHMKHIFQNKSVSNGKEDEIDISEEEIEQEVCRPKFPPQIMNHIFGKCYTYLFSEKLPYKGMNTKIEVKIRRSHNRTTETYFADMELKKLYPGFKKMYRNEGILYALHSGNSLSTYRFYRYRRTGKVNMAIEASVKSKEFLRVNTTNRKCSNSESVANCENSCLENQMAIHCRLPFMISDLPNCTSEELLKTYIRVFQVFENNGPSNCMNCPRFCKHTMYSVSLNGDVLDEDIVKLTFAFYDNTEEVIFEKNSYSFSMLLGDVGGSLGLFLGCCVLSILETLEEMIRSIRSYRFQR